MESPQWDFLVTGKTNSAREAILCSGFLGQQPELLLASLVRCWLVSPTPLKRPGGVGLGGGGKMEGGETVWEPRESKQGWLGRAGAALALSTSWGTKICVVTEA